MSRAVSGSDERERVVYEFGAFRADPVRRVLAHQGEPVAITPKALSILLVLLDRAGEVVEKKELIERVWSGAYVSEANLTQNIFSLRKTLAERGAGSRCIVTVPGQGYTFAAEVIRLERQSTAEIPIVVDLPPPPPAAEIASPVEPPPAVAELPPAPIEPPSPPLRRRFSREALAVPLAVVAVGAVLFGLVDAVRRPREAVSENAPATVRRAIAVPDFRSLAPRAEQHWLDTALAEMLTTELAAGGSMRVIRGETMAQAWRSLALDDPGRLGQTELQRLHQALGADFVVVGSYLPIGGKIRLDLRVLRAPGGEVMASFGEVGTEPDLFDLMSRIGGRLRNTLGIAEPSAQQVRETQALLPANQEARRLYAEGLARLRAFDPPGALDLLQRAAEADPDSAVIHSALAQSWSVLGYDELALTEARKARDLAESLPREDRLEIEGRFYKADKDWERASQAYRSLWTFFPDDVDYGLQLAESLLMGGRGTEAAQILAALRELPPPAGEDPRIDIVEARTASRLADFATVKRAAERAVAKGRRSGQSLVVAQALIYQGDALMKSGHTEEAIRLFRESAALCDKAGYQWGRGHALANVASGLLVLGDLDGAQAANEEALEIARGLGSAIGIAAQLLQLGELHRDRGELAKAVSLMDQSRQWSVRMGDRLREAQTLNAVGAVLRAQGDLKRARERFETASALSQEIGSAADEACSVDNLGGVLAAQGELAEAKRHHGKAFAVLNQAGDSSKAASALTAWAEATARLGDPRSAWPRTTQALAAKQRAGDRIGAGRILGLRSWLAYEMGNLGPARTFAKAQLNLAKETEARSLTAWALQSLGRVDFAAGDLAAARDSFEESLELSTELGEEPRAMDVRLDLAALSLAEDRSSEAARLAREAVAWYRGHGIRNGETEALSLLAEALVRQGKAEEARKAAARARAGQEASEDRELRVTVATRLARVEAALGRPEEALLLLQHAVQGAAKSGLIAAGLEARLALGEIRRSLGDPAAEVFLATVRQEAKQRGFRRLAASDVPPLRRMPLQ
jgi:eukaryotic-like serine/threonine-protein kinase